MGPDCIRYCCGISHGNGISVHSMRLMHRLWLPGDGRALHHPPHSVPGTQRGVLAHLRLPQLRPYHPTIAPSPGWPRLCVSIGTRGDSDTGGAVSLPRSDTCTAHGTAAKSALWVETLLQTHSLRQQFFWINPVFEN